MRIGVDVDGVLTDLESYQLKYGKKYFKNVKDIDENGYDICDIFHCTKKEENAFWTKHIWKYCLTEPVREGMKELLQQAKSYGDEIFIITGRAHTTEQNAIGSLFRKMLEGWLEKNEIPYQKVYYCSESNNSDEKYDICKRLGIDVMIEDKKENVERISTIANVICVASKNNRDVQESERVKRVTDINEDTYKLIQQFKPIDTGYDQILKYAKKFDRDEYKVSYGVVRFLGAPLFKGLLKPTIINKKYIPKNGPILLCGNHLHVWDQFPVICSTPRTTHWMSKKEYFDSKMGPFFKKTGAISVDRNGDPHSSTIVALNYLDIDSAIGLFPEGTRNHLKQEHIDSLYDSCSTQILTKDEFSNMIHEQQPLLSQAKILQDMFISKKISSDEYVEALNNIDQYLQQHLPEEEYYDTWLLPFKFGAVSMAQKTGAIIVPFGVTGNYKIGNDDLTVRYGEGFQVRPDDSLEEANTKLRNKILTLVKENKKM